MATGPEPGRPGPFRRLGRTFAAIEESLATSVRPWVILTSAALAVWVATQFFAGTPETAFAGAAFDATAWRASDGNAPDSVRRAMVADLADLHLRPGRERTELLALLGPPDSTDADGGARWFLGTARDGAGADTLALHFGADDRLTRWQCTQH